MHLFADLTVLHRLQPLLDYVTPLASAFASPPPPPMARRPPTTRPPAPLTTTALPAALDKAAGPSLEVSCDLCRISVRVPSPAGYAGAIRSGIAKLDVHGFTLRDEPDGFTLSVQRVGAFLLPAQGKRWLSTVETLRC